MMAAAVLVILVAAAAAAVAYVIVEVIVLIVMLLYIFLSRRWNKFMHKDKFSLWRTPISGLPTKTHSHLAHH